MTESPPYKGTQISTDTFTLLKEHAGLINKINEDYLYWDKVKYKSPKGVDPIDFWAAIKLSRMLGSKKVTFGKYTFSYFTTNLVQQALHYFDMNIGGNMGAEGVVVAADKNRYLVSSIMEEAISSSKMEGANTTRKKAKEMLRREEKPHNKSEQMIVNNYITINHIVANYKEELTVDRLLYIHKLITNGTLDKVEDEGCFRNNNDVSVVNTSTSETVHMPPCNTEMSILIDDLCSFFNEGGKSFIHPIVKGIIIHFMIGWIHPFADGNGRTARSLFYWYLLKEGYWLTEYLSISRIIAKNKNQYEKSYLYTEQDDNDLNYFIAYNLKAMEQAYDELKKYIQRKQQERNMTARFAKIPDINERQAFILQKIYDEPNIVFTVKEIENRFLVSNFTSRIDLNSLVNKGFLQVIQVNKKKKNFVKSDKYDELVRNYK